MTAPSTRFLAFHLLSWYRQRASYSYWVCKLAVADAWSIRAGEESRWNHSREVKGTLWQVCWSIRSVLRRLCTCLKLGTARRTWEVAHYWEDDIHVVLKRCGNDILSLSWEKDARLLLWHFLKLTEETATPLQRTTPPRERPSQHRRSATVFDGPGATTSLRGWSPQGSWYLCAAD